MVTPLQKHHGAHGGLIALFVLITTVIVVITSKPHSAAPPAPVKPAAAVAEPIAEPPAPTPAPKPTPTPTPRDVSRANHAEGTLSYEPHRTHHVAVPVYGWLQRTVKEGRRVRAGETLGVIYSPEVYLTTADVIAQLREYKSPEQLDAARLRLLRWGMRREQLAAIQASRRPTAELPLIARVTGTVVAVQGEPNQFVDPNAGLELVTITDPTYAVLYADVDAATADKLALGMTGRVKVAGRTYTAPIGYIARRAEDGKKTVRFDLHDPTMRFRAETPATVDLAAR